MSLYNFLSRSSKKNEKEHETLESLVIQIQGLSKNRGDINHLHTLLKKSDDHLRSLSPARLSTFLSQIDPSQHSLGHLYFLEAWTSRSVSKEQSNELIVAIATFINSCDADQIRIAPEKFTSVCKKLKEKVMLLDAPMRGVAPLLTAIRKLQPSSEHLTTIHPDFLLLCVLSKCYKTGLSILDVDIVEVDQPTDFFLYCYYGAMICIGQKRFRKALELLHNAATAPMSSINAIAVEAYKKHILVSLILHGQIPSLPKYTANVMQRNLKVFCQPYIEFAESYNKGGTLELEQSVQKYSHTFHADNNMGLVKQVVSSIYKRNIQRLTQTYLTLSLEDIANLVRLDGPKEAENHVLQMIQDGDIYATINQKDGMVRFLEDPEQYKSCEMIEHMDTSIQRMVTLSKKLISVDEVISRDPHYLTKNGRERQRFDYDDFLITN